MIGIEFRSGPCLAKQPHPEPDLLLDRLLGRAEVLGDSLLRPSFQLSQSDDAAASVGEAVYERKHGVVTGLRHSQFLRRGRVVLEAIDLDQCFHWYDPLPPQPSRQQVARRR